MHNALHNLAGPKIDVHPSQAQKFAEPHAGRDSKDVERAHPMISRCTKERHNLCLTQNVHIAAAGCGRRDAVA